MSVSLIWHVVQCFLHYTLNTTQNLHLLYPVIRALHWKSQLGLRIDSAMYVDTRALDTANR